MQHQTDKELLIAARLGSEKAFQCLFEKYWDDLFLLGCRRIQSSEDARDIVQDVFIAFWNNLEHIEIEESIAGYLFTALRNRIFNYYKKNAACFKMMMDQPFEPVQSEELIVSAIRTKELQAIITAEINRMPQRMREIYILSKEEQFTISEISSVLTLAPQTVKNQLHRALGRLRLHLQEQGIYLFMFFL